MIRPLQFRHGVHPPEEKELTAHLKVRRMPFPDEVVLPVRQHAGKPAKPIVKPGDRVERGDRVAEPDGWISVPIHASASGTVTDVGLWPHQDGSYETAVRIAVDPNSAQAPRPRMIKPWEGLEPKEIVAQVQAGGVVGLGGAAFPTHVKLAPPADKPIEVIIINGCECEPYLTTDHRLMVDYPERVHHGIRIMMRTLGVDRVMVGIEKNKPDAVVRMRETAPKDLDIEILPLRVRYPQGAEKMLIEALIQREVPSGGLPMDVGAIVQNVGSVASIAEIFETGLPLIERIVTVTGRGVKKPANLIVPVGTKIRELIEACGGFTDDAREVVSGGPMMGAAIANLDAPVTKGTCGIVVLRDVDVEERNQLPCISCGKCLDACPVFLNPQILGKLAMKYREEEMEKHHHVWDCMLCGCCSYVCPSHIPLSQLFAAARSALSRKQAKA
jgi:electron transport complex protein RnfC